MALQGCIEPHNNHLKQLGVEVRYVRLPSDLEGIDGLILPGGESTTILKLAKQFALWNLLKEKAEQIPFWGICAGAILMAKEVQNPSQESLAVMDVVVERNAYGRQVDSFSTTTLELLGEKMENAEAVFIRAPKFLRWGSGVVVKAKVNGDAVFLESDRHMITAFHPELTENFWCHKIFLEKCK